MDFLSLISTVLIGILCFLIYFGLSNFILDFFSRIKKNSFSYENSIRVVIFIAPAFLVLFVFIIFPVFETIRLSFYDKFGREFIGWNNYIWAINDPNFRRSILNNLGWLWIQTGLALVIFSAALRGIPKETLEAARIDGASEFRIFWSIIIPFLESTILVIWTIITILVLKVFDIIYAMTNGEWQTEVLANLMYDWMFRGGGDSGRGSVLAFCIMIGVIPILVWNLYRHRQEQENET